MRPQTHAGATRGAGAQVWGHREAGARSCTPTAARGPPHRVRVSVASKRRTVRACESHRATHTATLTQFSAPVCSTMPLASSLRELMGEGCCCSCDRR